MKYLTTTLEIISFGLIFLFVTLITLAIDQSTDIDYYNQYTIPLINKQVGSYTFSLVIWFLYLIFLTIKLKPSLPYYLFTFVVFDGQSIFIDSTSVKGSTIPYAITHPLYLILLASTIILMVMYRKHYSIKLNPYLFIIFIITPTFFIWLTAPHGFSNIPELVNSSLLCLLFYQGVNNEIPKRNNTL